MPDRRGSHGAVVPCRAALLLLIVTLLQACEKTLVTPVDIEQVEVVPSDITLVEGDRGTVSAILRETSGEALSGARVTWTIDDPEVASVTSEGVVEALSPGSTLLRASLEGVSGTAYLTVLRGPTLELSEGRVSLEATPGDMGPQSVEIDVRNAGAGTLEGLSVRVEGNGGAVTSWLTAELSATVAPTLLRLRADPDGLEKGVHEALVTVASSTTEEPAQLEVSLRVREQDRGPACEISSNFISGDLRIPTHTRCVIHDLYVAGNLRLDAGASVTGTEIRVNGNVEGKQADELILTDALILGNFGFEDGGSVTLRNSQVGGKVELKSNGGVVELRDNVIEDDVKLEKNRVGPFRLVGNTVEGKLECKDNEPPPSGTGNVAQQTTGQCSGL